MFIYQKKDINFTKLLLLTLFFLKKLKLSSSFFSYLILANHVSNLLPTCTLTPSKPASSTTHFGKQYYHSTPTFIDKQDLNSTNENDCPVLVEGRPEAASFRDKASVLEATYFT